MELKEYTSRHLGVPYVYLKDEKKYLCENGVVFTKEEYLKGIDLNAEYKKRSKNGELYDYEFARKNGKLRLLEKEEIRTYREDDRDFLLSIRNGAFRNEDGTYRQEFFDLVSDFENRLKYAKENTSLPVKPNMKRIEEFVMSVNMAALDI